MDIQEDSNVGGEKEQPAVSCTFFRKRPRQGRTNVRAAQKQSSGESDEDLSANIAEAKRKKLRKGQMTASTAKEKKESDDSDAAESDGQEEEDGPGCSGQVAHAHISNAHSSKVTELTEIDTPFDRDAQAQFERVQAELKKGIDTKIYKGAALYNATIKEDSVKGNASSGLVRLGQIRANQYVKRTIRWDFAPDVCKDYKETGFCTFGDSCKFMHDRSDYKHGWEIERDYQEGKMQEEDDDKYLITDSEDEDSQFPETCPICDDAFQTPVLASCSHHFCEKCAIAQSQKRKKCPIESCAKAWTGSFKYAKDLEKHLKEKEAKNEEVSDEDSDE